MLKQRRQRRGANALEFALTLPIFFSFFSGIIDCGWLFFQQSALDSAVHEGCRRGATLDPGVNNINLYTLQSTTDTAITSAMSQAGVACVDCGVEIRQLYSYPATSLRCAVSNTFTPLIGVMPVNTLTSVAVVRMEIQR